MDRFESMTLLLAALENGSLSKASRALRQPLPTVSRKIAELEAHLNANLLIRSAKGLELTPAGRSYVTGIRSILEQLSEVERAASGEYTEPRGDLAVTAPILFGRLHVLPIVTSFLTAYPDVAVNLVLTDRVTHFFEDQVDVALRIGDLPDSGLTAARVGLLRRVVCASPDYIASNGAPEHPADLARHRVVSFGSVSSDNVWSFWSEGREISTTFRSRLAVNTIDGAIDSAVSGYGLVRAMSYQVADHVRAGRLVLALEAFEPPARPVHMVYDKQSRLPLKLRAFVDFAVPRLASSVNNASLIAQV